MAVKVTLGLALIRRCGSLGKNKAQMIHQGKGFQGSGKHMNQNCVRL